MNGTVQLVSNDWINVKGDDDEDYILKACEVELISGYFPWTISVGDRVSF